MDILDIVFNRPDLIERAESAFGPESFEDSELSEIAAAAYQMYREYGFLNSDGIFAKNEGLRKKLLQVFEYGRNKGERDYETLLTRWIGVRESERMRATLKERARQDTSALSEIREVYEHRKRTKS
jgi:hypothetical protein